MSGHGHHQGSCRAARSAPHITPQTSGHHQGSRRAATPTQAKEHGTSNGAVLGAVLSAVLGAVLGAVQNPDYQKAQDPVHQRPKTLFTRGP